MLIRILLATERIDKSIFWKIQLDPGKVLGYFFFFKLKSWDGLRLFSTPHTPSSNTEPEYSFLGTQPLVICKEPIMHLSQENVGSYYFFLLAIDNLTII